MAIAKQEFYEGAALRILACEAPLRTISFEPPFFVLNEATWAYIKYCTRGRSPWGFTFAPTEHERMIQCTRNVVIGLVCGSDGIAAITLQEYREVVGEGLSASRIACRRRHGEHYEVTGPNGSLHHKVPPSRWKRIID